jgi:3',5'-cyclic AMP phosphodiesterase CpdA
VLASKDLFAILHISDLHRNEDGMVGNNQLFNSLTIDADSYTKTSDEYIPKPSIIIVSGDIIYGSHNSDLLLANEEIQRQYKEAGDLLNMLVDEFLSGDKSRIIIIPGNHDVQWGVSKASVSKVDHSGMSSVEKDNHIKNRTDPKTSTRWSWNELNFYTIKDEASYNNRLEQFSIFYNNFYSGERLFSLNPDAQYEIYDIPFYGVTIVGYNSCFRNDHLNRSGLINSNCLSSSNQSLRRFRSKGRILLAVWHHNFSGIPSDDTYLDPRQIKSLNSLGFSLGFHGHQHHSDIVHSYIQFEDSKKLVIVSAGTLCSARSHLPTGFKRQYNLIKFDLTINECTLYSRETIGSMDDVPIWAKGRINESMNSNVKLDIAFPNKAGIPDVTLEEIDTLTILSQSRNYSDFFKFIKTVSLNNEIVRALLLDVNDASNGTYDIEVCKLLNQPRVFSEYIFFLDHFIEKAMMTEASDVLKTALGDVQIDKSLTNELNKYKIRIYGY